MFLEVAIERVAKLAGGNIETLARCGEELIGPRQDARELGEMAAAVFHATRGDADKTALEVQRLLAELAAHWHGEFGGGGRRGRAHVRGEIDQRGIGLVADCRNQRNLAL